MDNHQIVKLLESLSEKMDKKFDAIDKRFDAIDKKLEIMDKRLDAVEEKLSHHDTMLKAIIHNQEVTNAKLESIELRVSSIEGELVNNTKTNSIIKNRLEVLTSQYGRHDIDIKILQNQAEQNN